MQFCIIPLLFRKCLSLFKEYSQRNLSPHHEGVKDKVGKSKTEIEEKEGRKEKKKGNGTGGIDINFWGVSVT